MAHPPAHGHGALVKHVDAKAVAHTLVLVRHQVRCKVMLEKVDVG